MDGGARGVRASDGEEGVGVDVGGVGGYVDAEVGGWVFRGEGSGGGRGKGELVLGCFREKRGGEGGGELT